MVGCRFILFLLVSGLNTACSTWQAKPVTPTQTSSKVASIPAFKPLQPSIKSAAAMNLQKPRGK